MATAPIPAGGIVSVPDGSGGAGAPVIVSQIVNANWANGTLLLNKSFELSDNAIGLADPAPQLLTTALDIDYEAPKVPQLPDNNPADAKALYDDTRTEIKLLTDAGYVDFLKLYFQRDDYYTAALNWLNRALTQGGTGLNVAVEQQLWERGRSRLGLEAMRAKNDTLQAFANRGFPMPPGALLHATQLIDQDMRDKLAEQSRDISIEAFRAELENTRFAISQAIDLRLKAIAATGDYVAKLLQGPQIAMQLTTTMAQLRTEYARTLVQFFTAQIAATDPSIRIALANAQLQEQGAEANLKAKSEALDVRVRAALANASAVATAAAASLNGINASASISGSDSSSI